MSFRLPPSLRLSLSLLLALAMLLQASAVVAMQTAMPAGPPAEAVVAEASNVLPPCHAGTLADADQPEAAACCTDGCDGFCQWACAHAFSMLSMSPLRVSVLIVAAPPGPRPALSARWHAIQALRPPIA
jgi:hypothetical protein